MRLLERIFICLLKGIFEFWHLFLSPLFGDRCRFTPSCSQYAKQSLEVHGLIRGLMLSLKRIVRCNSMCTGGYDPVLEKEENKDT